MIAFQIVLIIIALIFSIILLVLLFQGKLLDIIFDKEEYIEEVRQPKKIIEDEYKIVLHYDDDETFTMLK